MTVLLVEDTRLEASMVLGRPLRALHLRGLLSRASLASALVGVVVEGDAGALGVVHPEGLRDIEGGITALDDGFFKVVHPAALSAPKLGELRAAIAHAGHAPVFRQLDRRWVRVTRSQIDALVAPGCLADDRFFERAEALGYRPAPFNPDANTVTNHVRRLGLDASIDLAHEGLGGRFFDVHWDTPFDSRAPGLLSEVALDVKALIGDNASPG